MTVRWIGGVWRVGASQTAASARFLAINLLLTAAPATAQDASEVIVRLNRVENVARQLSGQIEQLQFENRQLKDQLRKFQEDVEFRFQEGAGKGGGGGARKPPAAAPPSGPSATPYGTNPGEGKPGKRGDAFDPEQSPGAPGAPRPLGRAEPSTPLAGPPVAQTQLAPPPAPAPVARAEPPPTRLPQGAIDDDAEDGDQAGGPIDLAPPSSLPDDGAVEPTPSTSVAATGSSDARADFEAAYALVQGRQYEQAEMSLRQFIQSHPRDKLVPKATYWLGESYLQRNRSREAAEQFLKVSTDYAASPVAPEAMLKLGVSLNALGAKAQACATLAEVERKYPSIAASVRQGVEREQKRARCAV